jgi:hypothetical protein
MKVLTLGIIFFLITVPLPTLGQVDYDNKSTEKIKNQPELEPESSQKNRRLLSIYIKNTQNVLYGNPCMDKVTNRFGFEYVVMPKNASKYHSGFGRVTHNFFVKTALFFRNPFWKLISNKKAKDCRQKTGDYAG